MGDALNQVVGVIPARYGSTRLPGKVLADLGGLTLIHRVFDSVARIRGLDAILVATDDDRVLREVLAFGATAVLTSREHRSGTDRVAEAIRTAAPDARYIINVQGDEPFLDPAAVETLIRSLVADPEAIWTAVAPLADESALARPDLVKAAVARDGRALYFSRAPIPYIRRDRKVDSVHWHHIGVYGFSREVLDRFVHLEESPLERAEGLEQLRALEAGIAVRTIRAAASWGGIDTPEDLERARLRLAAEEPRGGRE